MRPLRLTILSGGLFWAAVQSLAYPGPNPTFEVVIPLNAQSPKTTSPPSPHEVLKRQNSGGRAPQALIYPGDNTCGYLSGRLGALLACHSTRDCYFIPESPNGEGLRGCCDETDCGFVRACRDIEEARDSILCDNGCLMDTLTMKCTDRSFPYCNTVTWFSGITDYVCNSLNISTLQIARTTFSGQTDRILTTEWVGGSTTTSSKPSTLLTTTGTTTTSSSSSESTAPSSSSALPPQSPSPVSAPQEAASSNPAGAIAGGVVGGLAVIGLTIIGVIFLLRKKPGRSPPPPAPATVDTPSHVEMSSTPMPPPPANGKYSQQESVIQVNPAAAVPPGQGYQQPPRPPPQQYPPQGSVAVAYFPPSLLPGQQPYQQPSPTDPSNNRNSTGPPASPISDQDSQQQPQQQPQQQQYDQRHFSEQSFASNTTFPSNNNNNIQAYQPGPVTTDPNAGFQAYVPPQAQPQPPPPPPPPNVYEAGGNAVRGAQDLNPDHRGQIHQFP